MELSEIKLKINKATGIPLALLTADTAAAALEQAQTLLAFKRQQGARRPKSTREQFAEWMGDEPQDPSRADADALAGVARSLLPDPPAPAYPVVQDGGSSEVTFGDMRSPQTQLSEFIETSLAFDPRPRADGWTYLD